MASQFTLKSFDYQLTRFGIEHQNHRCKTGLQYHVFCDALNPLRKRQSLEEPHQKTHSEIVQEAIAETLNDLPEDSLNEKSLIRALENANFKLLQTWQLTKQPIKAAALIIAVKPLTKKNGEMSSTGQVEIFIAGVGDCRVFEIQSDKINPIFSDPKSIQASVAQNAETRLESLYNVLGQSPIIDVYCKKLSNATVQNFLIASWGFFTQATQWELLKLGLKPEYLTTKAAESLISRLSFDSSVCFSAIALENHSSPSLKSSFWGSYLSSSKKNKNALLPVTSLVGLITLVGAFQLVVGPKDLPLKKSNASILAANYLNNAPAPQKYAQEVPVAKAEPLSQPIVEVQTDYISSHHYFVEALQQEIQHHKQELDNLTQKVELFRYKLAAMHVCQIPSVQMIVTSLVNKRALLTFAAQELGQARHLGCIDPIRETSPSPIPQERSATDVMLQLAKTLIGEANKANKRLSSFHLYKISETIGQNSGQIMQQAFCNKIIPDMGITVNAQGIVWGALPTEFQHIAKPIVTTAQLCCNPIVELLGTKITLFFHSTLRAKIAESYARSLQNYFFESHVSQN